MPNDKKSHDSEYTPVELDEVEDGSDIIELTDEDGVTSEFQYLVTLEHEGESYVVLMALDQEADAKDDDEGEVVILKIEKDDKGEDIYVSCDDEEISEQVFDKFVKMLDEEDEEDEEIEEAEEDLDTEADE